MAYTTIDNPADYFNTVLYTGNGSTNAVTGVGFSPNWVWIKERDSTSSHSVSDTIRGTTKRLNPDLSAAEETLSGVMTSFDSDGFTNGADNGVNESGKTYVAWNWLAGVDAGSSNTDGSITSTVSANTTSGFSIVSWTHDGGNSTIGHGLGAVPQVVITKERNNTGSWNSYFSAVGNAHRMVLQGSNAKISSSIWNSTTPTSTVFSMNDSITSTMIAYCFAEKKGFSKFGSYVGNGSSNGTFVYTGFKVAWLMVKRYDSTGQWFMFDNKRDGFNSENHRLIADVTDTEADPGQMELLSNGFKWRFTSSNVNGNGADYLYMAFAENPFVSSSGIAGTAR